MSIMSQFTPIFRPGIPGFIPDAWIVSSNDGLGAPPVVAVHGITRNVDEMVEHLRPRASAVERTVVIPHFHKSHWPRYQRAACNQRSDWALLRLISALRNEALVGSGRFDLSGYSGGAQFAHRFAWLYPDMVGRLCATAPGWWTFPDTGVAWPYGIGKWGGGAQGFQKTANLTRFLDRRIVVCVGGDDLMRDDNLRKGAAIDSQQGTSRVERAARWCQAAETAARSRGLLPAISFRIMPGCGHSFSECVSSGGLDRDFVAPSPHHGHRNATHGSHSLNSPQYPERTAA